MKIFSGSSNKNLAENIAAHLELTLSPVEIFVFPDGEKRVQIQDTVVDEDVILVQSTNPSVNENYMELFLLLDGLKRSGARTINLVMPYIGYQRQDHVFRDGEAVSLAVVLHILESLKVDNVIYVDPHTIKLPEFFNISNRDLSALPLFAKVIEKNDWKNADTILVSPDLGGLRRIKIMSEMLDSMPWIATVKDRDLDTGSIVINRFEGPLPVAELNGKRAIIVDDMTSSGGTLIESAEFLKDHGVTEIVTFVTHPVFSSDAPQKLQKSFIDKLFVTDSVYVPDNKKFTKLEILSISDMIANELKK